MSRALLPALAAGAAVAGAHGLLATRGTGRLRRLNPTAAAALPGRVLAGRLVLLAPGVLLVLAGPVVAAGCVLLLGVVTLVSARRARAVLVSRRRVAVLEATLTLGAALRGGLPSGSAWRDARVVAHEVCPEDDLLAPVVGAPTVGLDLADALDAAAVPPGAEGLRRIAACWRVGSGTGAGLADALDRVADGLRREQALRRQVGAELAGPRATARLLAALPVAGILLGASAGADPLDVLLHTVPGTWCLAVGLTLAALGLAWVERIARAAEPPA